MIKRRMVWILIMSLLACGMAGCSAVQNEIYGNCYSKPLPQLLDATGLKVLFQDMAKELCDDGCATENVKIGAASSPSCDGNRSLTVMVTDFADLQTYIPNQYGLVMGELMRSSLNKACCYKIIQAEFAKYFKLSEKGLVILSRNVTEIKNDEYAQSEAVVGTYSYQNNNKVVIFVRRINMATGKITKMVTRELDYSCLAGSIKYTVK